MNLKNGQLALWSFEINEGTFHSTFLGRFYPSEGLAYTEGAEPLMESLGNGRQKVTLSLTVIDESVANLEQSKTILYDRYVPTLAWGYKFLDLTAHDYAASPNAINELTGTEEIKPEVLEIHVPEEANLAPMTQQIIDPA